MSRLLGPESFDVLQALLPHGRLRSLRADHEEVRSVPNGHRTNGSVQRLLRLERHDREGPTQPRGPQEGRADPSRNQPQRPQHQHEQLQLDQQQVQRSGNAFVVVVGPVDVQQPEQRQRNPQQQFNAQHES